MTRDNKTNKRSRVPKRTWWPHVKVYEACKKANVCALWHYKDGCLRGDSCPYKHELLNISLLIGDQRYDAAAIARGEQAEYPKSYEPPSHNNAKKQKSQTASMFSSVRPAPPQKGVGAKPAPAYKSCSSTSLAPKAPRTSCNQRETPKGEAHSSPLKPPAPVQPPASPRFASSKQQLSKVEKEIARLTAMRAVLETEAKREESSLNSCYTARCQRFEYVERPKAQMAGTPPYHVRYTAVKAHSLGYNDNKSANRTPAQHQCHRQLRAALRDSMQRTSCYNCRRCCKSLLASEQDAIACERCYAVLYCSIACLQHDAPAHAYQCYYHPGYCLRSEQAATGRNVPDAMQVRDATPTVFVRVSDDSTTHADPPPLTLDGGHATSGEETQDASAEDEHDASEHEAPAPPIDEVLNSIRPGPVRKELPSFAEKREYLGHDMAWSLADLNLSDSERKEVQGTAAFELGIATRETLVRYMDMSPCQERTDVMARCLAYGYLSVTTEPQERSFDVHPDEATVLREQQAYTSAQGT